VGLEQALALRAHCDYRGALAALEDANDAAALIERSRLHEDFGDYGAALADAKRAGSSPEALIRRAGVALALRDPREAERILAYVPGDEARAERACALLELARLDEAETLFRSVASDDPRVRLAVSGGLGSLARARGLYDDAERELRAAIEEAERTFGADSLETAGALNGLGVVFKYCGRFDEGAELYHRALEIVERAVGEGPDAAAIYHNLGGLEHARRNFEAAEPYARRSVEIRRRCAGPDHPAVAEDEAAMASILHALGQDEEAEQLLRHALEVLGPVLGPDHPEVAGAWNNLAAVLQRRGELDAAEEAYHRALEAKERTIGAEHPAVAITLNNLGVNARKRGRADEAEAYYSRALAIFDGRVEADHPNLLLTLRNYAKLLRAAGRDAEAAELERRRDDFDD
jgi:tetratricopeptide (TPR) repeat protein